MKIPVRFLSGILIFLCFSSGSGYAQSSGVNLKGIGVMEMVVARKGIKRVVKVFLNKKVSEEKLQEIARQIKNQDLNFYERTFIDYFLPGASDSISWATTHFNPDLKIKIYGLTIQEEKNLLNDTKEPPGEIIGKWLFDSGYMSAKWTIYRQGENLKLEKKYRDLSFGSKSIKKEKSKEETIFKRENTSLAGEYYLLNGLGNLEVWDQDGLITVGKKIKFQKKPPKKKISEITGEVIRVVDGDTLKIKSGDKIIEIRLSGIDCPEKKQSYGKKAWQFTLLKSATKIVTVRVEGIDRYGRTLGEVILPSGKNLNHELLKAGLAWWYKKYSKDLALEKLEKTARDQKKGLWQNKNPTPPWVFRVN